MDMPRLLSIAVGCLQNKPLIALLHSLNAAGRRSYERRLSLFIFRIAASLFSYDSAGNPLLWNGSVLQWERGRQLKAFGGITFTYDAGGVRQSKTANGVITSYFTEGNRIHREERSDGKTLLYAYDASGLASITYNGTLYFVQKNFLGDIVALVDQNGNVVAKYVYDAWGNGKVCNASGTENTSSSFIGNINPFRYRGYYYDVETGLYYLQTRYYEPRAGRFLNADSVDYIAPDIIGGLNLYAYCNNNPVMYSDPEGTAAWWEWLIAGLATTALIVGAVVATVSTGGIAAAVLTGAAVGASLSVATQATTGDIDLGQFAVDTVVGAISGAFSFGVSNIASSIGKGIGTYISNSAIGGLKIGKVFTGDILGSIGKKGGELLGGFAGGMFFDKYANKLFNKEDSLYERLQNNLQGSIFSEGLNFFRYLWRTI